MKRTLLAALFLLLVIPHLRAQDSLALRQQIEAENREALRQLAARPVVVAAKTVLRQEFPLWYAHLAEGGWGADWNYYPPETQELFLSIKGPQGDAELVRTRPVDSVRWSRPEAVCAEASSPGDEVFPMLSPDGRRLYFASDSLFGMGGFDLYVAEWDPVRKAWGSVRNLGLPFNSEGDDLLFCDTPDGRYSLFATNRACGKDSVTIYVIRQETFVYAPVADLQAAMRLRVTEPDAGWTFVRRNPGPVPALLFDEPEEVFDEGLRIGKEGAFAQNDRLPDGLVYQIQLFVSASRPTVKQLKGVSPVYAHRQKSGKTMYAAGLFRSYEEAETALREVRRAAFPSAFIIAFDDGTALSLQKARKKESSVKIITEEVKIVK